jgi:2-keto-3-deoxy-L-rhamnonate aldolase RhmA
MKNPIRAALQRGETVTGLILFSGSPMITELAAAAGIDFVIIDMEHSALDFDTCAHVVRAADAAGITPFVRIADVERTLILKLMNMGVAGIAISHATTENCAQCEARFSQGRLERRKPSSHVPVCSMPCAATTVE